MTCAAAAPPPPPCHGRSFLHGDDEERRGLFKMLPHIAEGSWLIRQSVGTTPVIIGRKLTTSFHVTRKYVEVAVDVGSSTTAQYVTGLVSKGWRARAGRIGAAVQAASQKARTVCTALLQQGWRAVRSRPLLLYWRSPG